MAPTSSTEEDKLHSGGELDRHQPLVVKRKRTKRPRHLPPASSYSASSSESTTTEEEDMAHCLILLAQGGGGAVVDSKPSPPAMTAQAPAMVIVKSERYTSRKYTEAATTADGVKAGFYVYECRTCNKCFPTFQALGGHRASHKKPRLLLGGLHNNNNSTITDDEMIIATTTTKQPSPLLIPEVTTALSLNTTGGHHHVISSSSSNTNKIRVHECSICGAEFSSGQALGGHMRRHRPLNAPPVITAMDKKETINLELDLNLPAPSDDEAAAAATMSSSSLPPPVVLGLGQFNDGNKATGLMLTASALVDCHY